MTLVFDPDLSLDRRPPLAETARAGVLSPEQLLVLARAIAADASLWRSVARHDPVARWHRRVAATTRYDVWLIGWDRHQGVDLHDHGGSAGAFVVIDGELTETCVDHEDGRGLRTTALGAGDGRAFAAGHVHRVVNVSDAAPATSLHVYSRPLVTMDFYEHLGGGRLERRFTEPALGDRTLRGEIR